MPEDKPYIFKINVVPGFIPSVIKRDGKYSTWINDEFQKEIARKYNEAPKNFKDTVGFILEKVTNYSIGRFRSYFKPGNSKFNIGATGKSADNFSASQTREGEWVITVGDLTLGNYYIKYGFKRASTWKRSSAKRAKVREWLQAKGINLTYRDNPVSEGQHKMGVYHSTKYVTQRSKLGKSYARRKVGSSESDKAFYILMQYLARGSKPDKDTKAGNTSKLLSGRKSHLNYLYPAGKPYFDYPGYLLDRDVRFRQILDKYALESLQLFIDWFSSSKVGGSVRTEERRRTFTID